MSDIETTLPLSAVADEPKNLNHEQYGLTHGHLTMNEKKNKKPYKRTTIRVPLHQQEEFDASNIPNFNLKKFHYRWVNAAEGFSNVTRYEQAGYEIVRDSDGKTVFRKGNGNTTFQYLMFLPIEIYNSDLNEMLEDTRKTEREIRNGDILLPGMPEGSLYVPSEDRPKVETPPPKIN